jgi:hypothetical protein
MKKFLVLLEIEYDGFVVGYFDKEYEAKLCIDKIKSEADQYEFIKLTDYAKDYTNYIKKYKIPSSNQYDLNTYKSCSNGTLTLYLHKIVSKNFNLDLYIANRVYGVSAIDITEDKYELISERIIELFPGFKVIAN